MNFTPKRGQEHSAYLQLFMFFIFSCFGFIIGIFLGFATCFGMYGFEVFRQQEAFLRADTKFLDGLKVLQILSTAGLFIIPPIFLSRFNGKKWTGLYGFKKPKLGLILVVLLIIICSMPILEWITVLNQKMTLPGFLKNVEQWMREKENGASEMTIAFLTVRNSWDFIINMFMIALLPAIGEELFFRGGLQQLFTKLLYNHHLAIWLGAIVFSAIHLQFFGFFPRLFLGAAFGYIYYWSGSLWYSMLAHFLNNGYAVCVALYMQKHHIPLDSTEQTIDVKWYGYVASLLLSVAVFQYFKNKTTKSNG